MMWALILVSWLVVAGLVWAFVHACKENDRRSGWYDELYVDDHEDTR